MGSEKTIETVISAGSTVAGESSEKNSIEEEPVSLIQHMARMGRRTSNQNTPANVVTIKKEVYIREEHTSPQV